MRNKKQDKLEYALTCVEDYEFVGYAYVDTLSHYLRSELGLAHQLTSPTETVELVGIYSVVATTNGPKVCLSLVQLVHDTLSVDLDHTHIDMDLLIDDIECAGDYQAWIDDLADNSDSLFESSREENISE